MKRSLVIIAIIILLFIVYLFLIKVKPVNIPELNGYEIVSEKGKVIDAKLYKRSTSLDSAGVKINSDEFVLVLHDSLSGRFEENDIIIYCPNIFLFYPKQQIIAVPNYKVLEKNGMIECFINEEKERFTIMVADTIQRSFENSELFEKVNYSHTTIIFNSFGKLKQFGDSVVIRFP